MMDRKERRRAYKETPTPMGVVRVYNTANGKSLVEASRNTQASLNRHQFQLKMGVHHNRPLVKDWETFGPDAFRFEVLDTLAPPDTPDYDPANDLKVLEDLWLDKLQPFGEAGYNTKKCPA
jgi:hypothetical protein